MHNSRSLEASIGCEPVVLEPIGNLYGGLVRIHSYQPSLSLRRKLRILAINHPEEGYFQMLLEWSKKHWLIPAQVREVTVAYREVFNKEEVEAH